MRMRLWVEEARRYRAKEFRLSSRWLQGKVQITTMSNVCAWLMSASWWLQQFPPPIIVPHIHTHSHTCLPVYEHHSQLGFGWLLCRNKYMPAKRYLNFLHKTSGSASTTKDQGTMEKRREVVWMALANF